MADFWFLRDWPNGIFMGSLSKYWLLERSHSGLVRSLVPILFPNLLLGLQNRGSSTIYIFFCAERSLSWSRARSWKDRRPLQVSRVRIPPSPHSRKCIVGRKRAPRKVSLVRLPPSPNEFYEWREARYPYKNWERCGRQAKRSGYSENRKSIRCSNGGFSNIIIYEIQKSSFNKNRRYPVWS